MTVGALVMHDWKKEDHKLQDQKSLKITRWICRTGKTELEIVGLEIAENGK